MEPELKAASGEAAGAFDPVALAAELMLEQAAGTLATIEDDTGYPMATLATIALDTDGAPLIFVSGLSAHTRNLIADARFSLLLARTGKGDPLAHPRLTLLGRGEMTRSNEAKQRFITRNPKAKLYQDFPDFSLWRLVPERLHLNGGFAKAHAGPAAPVLERVRAGLEQSPARLLDPAVRP